MHTVEMLEALLAQARAEGYSVRAEWLGGQGGGVCEIRGRRTLFVDLDQDVADQLSGCVAALRQDDGPVQAATAGKPPSGLGQPATGLGQKVA